MNKGNHINMKKAKLNIQGKHLPFHVKALNLIHIVIILSFINKYGSPVRKLNMQS